MAIRDRGRWVIRWRSPAGAPRTTRAPRGISREQAEALEAELAWRAFHARLTGCLPPPPPVALEDLWEWYQEALGPIPGPMASRWRLHLLPHLGERLEEGVILVRYSHGRPAPKNGRWRELPIPRELGELLRGWRRPEQLLLFPGNSAGGRLCVDARLTRTLRHRLSQLGVARQLRFHDLRHSFTTLALEAGCNPEVVRMALGHSPSITGRYAHPSIDWQRDRKFEKASRRYNRAFKRLEDLRSRGAP